MTCHRLCLVIIGCGDDDGDRQWEFVKHLANRSPTTLAAGKMSSYAAATNNDEGQDERRSLDVHAFRDPF